MHGSSYIVHFNLRSHLWSSPKNTFLHFLHPRLWFTAASTQRTSSSAQSLSASTPALLKSWMGVVVVVVVVSADYSADCSAAAADVGWGWVERGSRMTISSHHQSLPEIEWSLLDSGQSVPDFEHRGEDGRRMRRSSGLYDCGWKQNWVCLERWHYLWFTIELPWFQHNKQNVAVR